MRRSSRHSALLCICRKSSSMWSVLVRRRSSAPSWTRSVRINCWHRTSTSSAIPATCHKLSTMTRQSARLDSTNSSWYWKPRVASTATFIVFMLTICWNISRACLIRFRRRRLVETMAKFQRKRHRHIVQRHLSTRWIRLEWIWRPRHNRQWHQRERSEQHLDHQVKTRFRSRRFSARHSMCSKNRTRFFQGKIFMCHRPNSTTMRCKKSEAIRTTTSKTEID